MSISVHALGSYLDEKTLRSRKGLINGTWQWSKPWKRMGQAPKIQPRSYAFGFSNPTYTIKYTDLQPTIRWHFHIYTKSKLLGIRHWRIPYSITDENKEHILISRLYTNIIKSVSNGLSTMKWFHSSHLQLVGKHN